MLVRGSTIAIIFSFFFLPAAHAERAMSPGGQPELVRIGKARKAPTHQIRVGGGQPELVRIGKARKAPPTARKAKSRPSAAPTR